MTQVPEDLDRPLSPADVERLNAEIMAGHAAGTEAHLAYGYRTGGQDAVLRGDIDTACFLFTQAYVFALRAGLRDVADDLWSRLESFGREA